MENLNERAANYAAEKVNELLANAIAQAYADGYRDGYDDAENKGDTAEIVNAEVFDMGLPSKTWWTLKYLEDEKEDTNYLSYPDASKLGLPTLEQVEELIKRCRWQGSYSSSRQTFYGADCQGASGKIIEFLSFGYKEGDKLVEERGEEVDRSYYKNSSFVFKGLPVENHRYCCSIKRGTRTADLEAYLESLLFDYKPCMCLNCPEPLPYIYLKNNLLLRLRFLILVPRH